MPFLLLGVAIGIVLGGTQALARSYFSLLIPRGKEAEYFSFYHAMERGTSWFGTLVFGLVYQFTDSYRPAIFALIVLLPDRWPAADEGRHRTRHPRGGQRRPGGRLRAIPSVFRAFVGILSTRVPLNPQGG